MNVVERAREGYGRDSQVIRSGRTAEYQTLARISHRLGIAAQNAKRDFPTYISALDENRKLWRVFATDVAHPDNELPANLRARIFYLAEFVEEETRRLMKRDGDISALMEINAAILNGLRGGDSQQ